MVHQIKGLSSDQFGIREQAMSPFLKQASQWLAKLVERPRINAILETADMASPSKKRARMSSINEKHVFFDVETHGISKVCLAIQLSYLVTELTQHRDGHLQLKIADHFNGCFHSDYISPGATAIHGIDTLKLNAMANEGKLHEWKSVTPVLIQHMNEAKAIIGHNLSFDIRSMRDTLAYHNMSEEASELERLCQLKKQCTLQMARRWTKETDNAPPSGKHKLTHLHEHIFGSPLTEAHDAAADTLATAAIYYHLQAEGIAAAPSRQYPKRPTINDPEEVHNTPKNAISWLLVEHNQDRRHIIAKSILRLWINDGLKKYGPQTLAHMCTSHPQFSALAEVGLNDLAQVKLKMASEGDHSQPVADIVYLLFKHNRLNYFLGESSWNRAIGAPMRFLRSSQPRYEQQLGQAQSVETVVNIFQTAMRDLHRCFTQEQPDQSHNVSFEDPRGPWVQQEGATAINDLQSQLRVIEQAFVDVIQTETTLDQAKHQAHKALIDLQDSFAFDPSQSHHDEVRTGQNQNLASLYGEIQRCLAGNDIVEFKRAFDRFMGLNAQILINANLDPSIIHDPKNPVYAARALNQLIKNRREYAI